MSLTPQDIQSQQFHVRFRGFDMDEVDDFLEKVADQMLTVIQENKQLKERLEELGRELAAYRDQEKSFQKAMVSAQQIADEMRKKSEQEARTIVAEAREEAENLRQQAHNEVAAIERRLDDLRGQKETIKEELRAMLNTYLSRLDEEPAAADDQATEQRPVPDKSTAAPQKPQQPDQDDDASDLFQKIDIPDEDLRFEEEEDSGTVFNLAEESGPEEEQSLPDLEGEMLFNLDDPLDDLTPDIKIKDEDA